MRFKKMLLLLSAIAAFVAFAAPAAQANSTWTTDPGEVELGGPEEPTSFTATGSLTFKASFITGPVVVHATGNLWNGAVHGEGSINTFEITGTEIPTSLSGLGCNAHTATASNLPWAITLTTNQVVDIKDMTFTYHYNEACQKLGVPATVRATGDVSGTYNNATGCIGFGSGGDSVIIEGTEDTTLDTEGQVCLHEEGGTFTAN